MHRLPFMLCLILLLAGCAGFAPVPGGTDDVNNGFFKTREDFLARVNTLVPGHTKEQVLAQLGHTENELQRMNREELIMALMGTNNLIIQDGIQNQQMRYVLQYLQGYKLNYKFVEREHGFTSPIRWRTDETGYNYITTLVFYNNQLLEKPVVSGGEVNSISSKTLFDFLNPGTAMSVAAP